MWATARAGQWVPPSAVLTASSMVAPSGTLSAAQTVDETVGMRVASTAFARVA
jgi:hypothetical protein